MTILDHPIRERTKPIDRLVEKLAECADELRFHDARDLSLTAFRLRDGGRETQYDIIDSIEIVEDLLAEVKIKVENYRARRSA